MKSTIIQIDNQGNGFADAIQETRRAGAAAGLSATDCLRLQLCAEEMLCLARSVTGEMHASFYLEGEGQRFDLHMTTQTVMDKQKRSQLISAASSRKNEAAKTLLGKLRDKFEAAMAAEVVPTEEDIPANLADDLVYYHLNDDREWDGYERSVLRKAADDVKIAIRGKTVEMTVSKQFA